MLEIGWFFGRLATVEKFAFPLFETMASHFRAVNDEFIGKTEENERKEERFREVGILNKEGKKI